MVTTNTAKTTNTAPKSKAPTAPKSKAPTAPKSKAPTAPKSKAPKSKAPTAPKSKAPKGRKITKAETTIITKLASIHENKVVIKKLQDENKASYETILPLMRTEIKTLKNSNKTFQAYSKKELIAVINTRYNSTDKLVKNVLTCLFENLTIDKKITVSLFNDTIKFLDAELITKTQINNSTLEQLEIKIKSIREEIAKDKARDLLGL